MDLAKYIIGGLVGALLGAAAWAAIYHYADFEFGLIAWGIGIGAGFGVRIASGNEASSTAGVVAVLCAVLGLAGGKYAGVYLDVQEVIADASEADHRHEARVYLADEIVESWEAQGREVSWPEGMTMDEAWEQSDYPEDVWAEMDEQWQAMDQNERDGRVAEVAAFNEQYASELTHEVFMSSFTPFDLLWFGLALYSAWHLAAREEMT